MNRHHSLGYINLALYAIGSNPAKYAADFYDVTTGNNQADPSIPGHPATQGWDPVTGLSTPNAAKLLPDLIAQVNGIKATDEIKGRGRRSRRFLPSAVRQVPAGGGACEVVMTQTERP